MKYNVQNAVSGYQKQQSDMANRSNIFKALGGIAGGASEAVNLGLKREQQLNLQTALENSKKLYESMGMSEDPIVKMMAQEKLNNLSLLQAGTNINTLDQFGTNYKALFGGMDSPADAMLKLVTTKMMADARGKYFSSRGQNDQLLADAIAGLKRDGTGVPQPKPRTIMDNVFDFGRNYGQKSSNPYDTNSFSDYEEL